jgi:hypothetical protein
MSTTQVSTLLISYFIIFLSFKVIMILITGCTMDNYCMNVNYGQCGGEGYAGTTCCPGGYTCTFEQQVNFLGTHIKERIVTLFLSPSLRKRILDPLPAATADVGSLCYYVRLAMAHPTVLLPGAGSALPIRHFSMMPFLQ